MRGMTLLLVSVMACGNIAPSDEPCEAGALRAEDAAPPAPAPPNANCIETDQSITTCMRGGAAGSWTAPETCMRPDRTPAIPQKLNARGEIVERDGRKCCGFVRVDNVVALCCADLRFCLGPE